MVEKVGGTFNITIELNRSRWLSGRPTQPPVSQSDFTRPGVRGCRPDIQVTQVLEKQLQEVQLDLKFSPNGA
jgi:hypothetical protein